MPSWSCWRPGSSLPDVSCVLRILSLSEAFPDHRSPRVKKTRVHPTMDGAPYRVFNRLLTVQSVNWTSTPATFRHPSTVRLELAP